MAKIFTNINSELTKILNRLICREGYKIACIGTELRSDDAIGILICNKLSELGIDVIRCDYGIENCIDDLVRRNVDKLILIDAVLCNASPGSYVLMSIDELTNDISLTTHTISPKLVINYLRKYFNLCRDVIILGIRVKNLNIGTEISKEVLRSSLDLINLISLIYRGCRS